MQMNREMATSESTATTLILASTIFIKIVIEAKQVVEIFTRKMPKLYQMIFRHFYLLLEEECRAYLIHLRVEWLGSRSKNWYTNLEVNAKSLIFLLDLYFGLVLDKIKCLNPMKRKPKF